MTAARAVVQEARYFREREFRERELENTRAIFTFSMTL